MPDITICRPLYRFLIRCTMLASPIGPAGDVLYVPFYFSGGEVEYEHRSSSIFGGGDFAALHFDEQLVHEGRFVVQSENGATLFYYTGTSQGPEGTYDALLDGRLPEQLSSTLSVCCISANPEWRVLNRLHLPASGTFDIATGVFAMTVWTVT